MDTAIGTGETNTSNIVTAQGGETTPTYAAWECYDLSYGGYSDWFLSSEVELSHLYTNRESIGGYTSGSYLSSSSDSQTKCSTLSFSGAGSTPDSTKKDVALNARAVRYF